MQKIWNSQGKTHWCILIWRKFRRVNPRMSVDRWWIGKPKTKKNPTGPHLQLHRYRNQLPWKIWYRHCHHSCWRHNQSGYSRRLRQLLQAINSTPRPSLHLWHSVRKIKWTKTNNVRKILLFITKYQLQPRLFFPKAFKSRKSCLPKCTQNSK